MENNNNVWCENIQLQETRSWNSLPVKCSISPKHDPNLSRISKSLPSSFRQNNKDLHMHSKTEDVQKIVRKIRNVFSAIKSTQKESKLANVIERDYEVQKNKVTNVSTPEGNNYGTFDDADEYKTCMALTRQLKQSLVSAKESPLLCDLIVPVNLLSKIAQDITRMSHCEPCGVRGCVIFVSIESGSGVTAKTTSLGKVVCDSSIVPTFELHVSLKEDTQSWANMRKLWLFIKNCFRDDKHNVKKNTPKVLSDGFQLVKNKLYRPN